MLSKIRWLIELVTKGHIPSRTSKGLLTSVIGFPDVIMAIWRFVVLLGCVFWKATKCDR